MLRNLRRFARSRSSLSQQHRNSENIPKYAQIERDIESGKTTMYMNKALKSYEDAISDLETKLNDNNITFDDVILPLERMEEEFGTKWRALTHLTYVKNSDMVRETHEKLLPKIIAASSRANQSPEIFQALMKLQSNGQDKSRIVEKRLQDMTLSGVGLPKEKREIFNANKARLSSLSTNFANTVMDDTKNFKLTLDESQVQGMPETFLKSKRTDDNGYEIGLDAPSYLEIMKSCASRDVREVMWKANTSRGSKTNPQVISQILSLRKEQANLLGFETHAQLSLSKKMAGNVDAVQNMIDMLKTRASKCARREMKTLQSYASDVLNIKELQPWDLTFVSERLKESKFGFDEESLKPFFPKKNVLRGLFELCEKLFDVNISQNREIPDDVLWHDDVMLFDVTDVRSGEYLASFFLDPYARVENKRGGAWMDNVLSRQDVTKPVANLVCNFAPNEHSLMTFDEVKTLFHETGHALQHMLTNVTNSTVSGIDGVEWDAVELPSQFMENFLFCDTTMKNIARHYETGEVISSDMLSKLRHIHREFNSGIATMRQLNFAALDIGLHHGDCEKDPIETQFEYAHEFSPLPPHPDDRFVCSFLHIFAGGYSAGYYSYKYAEILSADAFGAFEEVGLDNDVRVQEIGRRFRDTVLSLGGSVHPSDVYKMFRGRDPDPEALLRHSGIA